MIDKYLIDSNSTVKKTIEKMELEKCDALLIVNSDRILLGIFTMGDMRRFFLRCVDLSVSIENAMNKAPIVFYSRDEVAEYMSKHKLVVYPIVDECNRVIDVIFNDSRVNEENISSILHDIPLVIMAGGKGTRLYPYTKILPKALIPIGEKTITERIINNFERYGCKKVFFILNYKSGMIKAYYNDLKKNYEVDYIDELNFLGTAGGLRLLKDKIKSTFFVSNCDILINADLECIYKTHVTEKNKITFVCSMKELEIPYGVIETNSDGSIRKIKEKPEYSFLVNTGLYVLEPEVLNEIGVNEYIHLPDLAQKYIERGERVGVFPISERAWMDMGQFNEMDKMLKTLGV